MSAHHLKEWIVQTVQLHGEASVSNKFMLEGFPVGQALHEELELFCREFGLAWIDNRLRNRYDFRKALPGAGQKMPG